MTIDARFESGDERDSPRRRLRLGIGGRFGGDRTLAATVHNLSVGGLLIETPVALSQGETIEIDLPEAGPVAAEVVWSDGPFHGCRFDRPISDAAVSAARLQSEPVDEDSPAATALGEDFGERIHRLRVERGLSLADVADRLGVSKPTVWAWEHGKSRPVEKRLPALADALGVTPGGLEPAASGPPEILERSRRRVAEAYGVEPSRVRIMIEL